MEKSIQYLSSCIFFSFKMFAREIIQLTAPLVRPSTVVPIHNTPPSSACTTQGMGILSPS